MPNGKYSSRGSLVLARICGDIRNENHRLFSPSDMYLPEMAERNRLLLACAASASRIRPRPVCRSSASWVMDMSKYHLITIVLGCVVAYFLLADFCLSESPVRGLADDPTVKGKGRDGACMDYALALSSRRAAKGIPPLDLLPMADSRYGNWR